MLPKIEQQDEESFYILLHMAGSLSIQQLAKEQIKQAKRLLGQGHIQRQQSVLLPSIPSICIEEAQGQLEHSPQLRAQLEALIETLQSAPLEVGSPQLRQVARLQLILKQDEALLESFELYGNAQHLGLNPDRDHSLLWQHILGAQLQGYELIPAGQACLEVSQIQQKQGILSQSLRMSPQLAACPPSLQRQHILAHRAMRYGSLSELEHMRRQSPDAPLLHAYISILKGQHEKAHQYFTQSLGSTQHEIYRIQSEELQAAYPWAILNAILLDASPRLIGYWIEQLSEQILPIESPFQHEAAARADAQVIELLRRLQAQQINSGAISLQEEQEKPAQKQINCALSPLAQLIIILLYPQDIPPEQSQPLLQQAEQQEDYHYAEHLARLCLSDTEQSARQHKRPHIKALPLSRAQKINESQGQPKKSESEIRYHIYWDILLEPKSQRIKQTEARLLAEDADSQQRGRILSLEKLKQGYYAEYCQKSDYALLTHIQRKANSPILQWQVQASGLACLSTQPRLRLIDSDGSLRPLRLYAIPEERSASKAQSNFEEMPCLELQSDGSYHITIQKEELATAQLPTAQPPTAQAPAFHLRARQLAEQSAQRSSGQWSEGATTSVPAISLNYHEERLQIIWGIYEQAATNPHFLPASTAPVSQAQAAKIRQLIKENQAILSSGKQQATYSWAWQGLPLALDTLRALQALHIPLLWQNSQALNIHAIPEDGIQINTCAPLKKSPSSRTKKSSQEIHWLEIGAQIRVDETRLYQIEDLLLLNRQKISHLEQHFLPIGKEQYILINPEQSRQLDSLQIASQSSKGHKSSQVRQIHPSALLRLAEQWSAEGRAQLPLDIRESLAQVQQQQTQSIEAPPHICASLRPYQKEGYEWLVRKAQEQIGVILADDMGLGKTIQSLSLLAHQSHLGASLIIAPLTLIDNWMQESQRFFPQLRVQSHKSTGKQIPQLRAGDIYLASYGQISSQKQLFSQQSWNEIILDEAHAIKNPSSQRSAAILTIPARHRVALTGTPLENRILELWSIMEFLNPGHLGKKSAFQALSKQKEQLHAIREHIAPLILRRQRHDVLRELPPLTEIRIPIELSEEERVLYESTRRRALLDNKNKENNSIHCLAALSQLRTICNNAAQILPSIRKSSKIEALNKLCIQLHEKGHRALIFSSSTQSLQAARRRIEKSIPKSSLYFDGKSSKEERSERIASFQEDAQHPFFFISLQAGGSGINLTAADYVILLDPWWNPAREAQAAARAHRMGQGKAVTLCRLICHDSIEEHILRLQQEKRELSAELEQITQSELQNILRHRIPKKEIEIDHSK